MTAVNIVVVGGGAGGLPLVTRLGRRLGKQKKANITLVDCAYSHVWKPRFHEVATGAIDADLDALDYRAHASQNHYRFEPGKFIGMDAEQQTITLAPITDHQGNTVLPERTLPYDYLVLAIGSQSNDFNTPGVKEHAFFLDSRRQAERFRENFLNSCLQADYHDKELSVAIVGAGATGVELAAEIHHAISVLKLYGHEHLDRKRLKVHLIEAAPRVLPALTERVSQAAHSRLEKLGVRVHVNALVEKAEPNQFFIKDAEPIKADLLVWAAGIKAPEVLLEVPGVEHTRNNQIVVEPTLHAKGQERIFVIGDAAACQLPDMERPIPPRAQSAQQMANYLSKQLQGYLLKGKPFEPFVYRDHGSLVSLSQYSSVGNLMGSLKGGNFFIEGWLARMMYISLYRLHQATLYGWPRTIMLLIAGRFNRLVRPRLKLH